VSPFSFTSYVVSSVVVNGPVGFGALVGSGVGDAVGCAVGLRIACADFVAVDGLAALVSWTKLDAKNTVTARQKNIQNFLIHAL
jgi:hypothetical protein